MFAPSCRFRKSEWFGHITVYSLANVGYFLWHLILKLSLSICGERARKKKEEEERRMEREREKVSS